MPDVVGLLPTDPQRIAQYRVLGRLGSGGQGVVYLGERPGGGRVAIKQLLSGLPELADSRARRQLAKEVAAAQRVAPFCTAQILDADVTGPSPFIVSEYIEGPSLQQLVRERGPLTGSALQWMAVGTATALAAIHQAGVVHRDFKPANVMMAADGPRVIDFGIARDLSTDVTVTSRVMGTPAYMAPEQVRNEPVGPATDLFAWASVVAFAATGRAPFEAGHMLAVAQRITSEEPDLGGVPEPLVPVLRRCLVKDPAQRPTAQQVLGMLLGRPDASPAQAAGLVHRASAPESAPAPTLSGPPPREPGRQPGRQPGQQSGRQPGQQSGRQPGQKVSQDDRSYVGRTVAVAVVVLLLGAAVWGWAQADDRRARRAAAGTGDRPTATATKDPATSDSTAPATQPPTTAPTEVTTSGSGDSSSPIVPEALDGTWEGREYQPLGQAQHWNVRLDLDAGDSAGEYEMDDLGCKGSLTVVSSTDRTLTMDTQVEEDDQGLCVNGRVKLTYLGLDGATFFWQDSSDSSNIATGFVNRH